MSVQDMRQGRGDMLNAATVARALRGIASCGVVNHRRDTAILRAAAVMLEQQEPERAKGRDVGHDVAGLIAENVKAHQRIRQLEELVELLTMEAKVEAIRRERETLSGASRQLPQGGALTETGDVVRFPCGVPGIDFEAPAPTELW